MAQGNIAAGKSTLLEILDDDRFDVVPEPITKWQQTSSAGGNLLELFYNDTDRWAYTFQSYAFLSRMRAQLEVQGQRGDDRCRMFERSIVSDREVFAVNCHETGVMSDVEWDIYCDWHAWLLEAFPAARCGAARCGTERKNRRPQSIRHSKQRLTYVAAAAGLMHSFICGRTQMCASTA